MRLLIALCVLLLFVSCSRSNGNEKKSSIKNASDSIIIELYLYPAGNFRDVRYSVILEKGILVVKNHSTIGTMIPQNASNKKLSFVQIETIKTLVNYSKFRKEEATLVINGSWGCKLIANNNEIFESNCFRYESLKDEDKLMVYLLSLLPFELELYGFS